MALVAGFVLPYLMSAVIIYFIDKKMNEAIVKDSLIVFHSFGTRCEIVTNYVC